MRQSEIHSELGKVVAAVEDKDLVPEVVPQVLVFFVEEFRVKLALIPLPYVVIYLDRLDVVLGRFVNNLTYIHLQQIIVASVA